MKSEARTGGRDGGKGGRERIHTQTEGVGERVRGEREGGGGERMILTSVTRVWIIKKLDRERETRGRDRERRER